MAQINIGIGYKMMNKTILITCFEGINSPSRKLAEAITSKHQHIKVIILRHRSKTCQSQLHKALNELKPEIVISLGLKKGTKSINLERIAINVDEKSEDKKIVTDGPVAYLSTLPLESIYKKLKEEGVPVRISNNAGVQACNYVFYYSQYLIEKLKLDTKMGLVHIPRMSAKGMKLEEAVKAVEIILNLILLEE